MQTPLFHTLADERYRRQERMAAIEAFTGRQLICWVADDHGQIDANDVAPFADLLHKLDGDADVDLLLRSPGGVIDTADKLLMMLRKRCRGLRVIVPESAKSAATLIALGADEIVMGFASELGPIDPQVPIQLPNGNWDFRPAHSVLDGIREIVKETEASGELSAAYLPTLQFLDPALLDVCRKAIERSRALAEAWLLKYQCVGELEKAAEIAEKLEDPSIHLSHGAVIDSKMALSLGLRVMELDPVDPFWEHIWRLYVDLLMGMRRGGQGQLFESRHASVGY